MRDGASAFAGRFDKLRRQFEPDVFAKALRNQQTAKFSDAFLLDRKCSGKLGISGWLWSWHGNQKMAITMY